MDGPRPSSACVIVDCNIDFDNWVDSRGADYNVGWDAWVDVGRMVGWKVEQGKPHPFACD